MSETSSPATTTDQVLLYSEEIKGFSGKFNLIFSHTFERDSSIPNNVDNVAQYRYAWACGREFVCFGENKMDVFDVNDRFKKIKTFDLVSCNLQGIPYSVAYCKKDHSCIFETRPLSGFPIKISKIDLRNGEVKWSTSFNSSKNLYNSLHSFVMDTRGIIYLLDQTSQQIVLICSESGQIIDKIGKNCKTTFNSEAYNPYYLSMDRNDNLLVTCYDQNWIPILKMFTRNLKYVKTLKVSGYYFSAPLLYDPISDGYIFRSHNGIQYASKDFEAISQKNITAHFYSLSNGVGIFNLTPTQVG
ncbi:hypothetical protein C9374_010765 [Naegleria lovaniensis]|uniref:Uncharacterized protein n=1 Tax=Naegleria lovaniensis TaxID=51637 RepID=A0AA88KFX7_NAELO|nr:uncharacterized protein C9374_010765 [Naegleria lovaniensis]KAG2374481.1 hypothetical protein C9374_010765 [Naegleria lovaniensis]